MDKKILEFATILRKTGVTVSHSEVSDCLIALSLVGMDRDIFYNTLASTLIKDQSYLQLFDKLFNYYFNSEFFAHADNIAKKFSPKGFMDTNEKICIGANPDTCSNPDRSTGFGQGQGLSTAAADNFINIIKIGDSAEMKRLIKKGIESLGSVTEDDLIEMKEPLRQVKVFLDWNMGVYRLENDSVFVDESKWLDWQENLHEMETLLYRELEKKLMNQLGHSALETILIRENLNQLDFYKLSAPQISEIKKKISKLGHKLASRLSFRRKRARHGRIDLPKTIRKSMSTGGVPVAPAFKDRYPNRPEFVILCDLSGSVKAFSEFMLQLVYSIQNRFIHVRSFVFVDTPDDITSFFRNREIEDGIKDVYNQAVFSKTAFSDYGQMFIGFQKKYSDVLTKRTNLLVIGDARNNYQKEHADYFQSISKEVKKTFWLNPEPVEKWDQEDSVMSVYGRHCDQVYECRNLEQLGNVARRIF